MRSHPGERHRAALFATTCHVIAILLMTGSSSSAQDQPSPEATSAAACAADNGGITLPPGFCATVFADGVGHARHLVVAPNGVVYVNTWSGRYYGNDTPPAGGFLVALQDTTGDGRADVNVRFGDSVESGSAGGTGIALHQGALFAEVDDRIVRYASPEGAIAPTAAPEVIVSGLPLSGDHQCTPSRSMRGAGCTSTPAPPRDPGRDLALRRQPDGTTLLARRALRHRDPQCG
jgi:glucose/arabinose dehydrogenase